MCNYNKASWIEGKYSHSQLIIVTALFKKKNISLLLLIGV